MLERATVHGLSQYPVSHPFVSFLASGTNCGFGEVLKALSSFLFSDLYAPLRLCGPVPLSSHLLARARAAMYS